MSDRPNVLALSWIDSFLGLEEDYRRLWGHYTELQRAYVFLRLQLREERELRIWAASEIETKFPERPAA